jgi:hypothetical protein
MAGEAIIVDNYRALHIREAYSDVDRFSWCATAISTLTSVVLLLLLVLLVLLVLLLLLVLLVLHVLHVLLVLLLLLVLLGLLLLVLRVVPRAFLLLYLRCDVGTFRSIWTRRVWMWVDGACHGAPLEMRGQPSGAATDGGKDRYVTAISFRAIL